MKINHHESNRKKRTVDGPRELVTLESVENMSPIIFALVLALSTDIALTSAIVFMVFVLHPLHSYFTVQCPQLDH